MSHTVSRECGGVGSIEWLLLQNVAERVMSGCVLPGVVLQMPRILPIFEHQVSWYRVVRKGVTDKREGIVLV